MGARERVLKVGSKGLGKGTSLGFKFGVILGLYQFQNWGCGRIASSGKDKIARCVTERMMSDVTQYSDLDCVEKFCLTFVVGHEATVRVYCARSAFRPESLLRIPEEYPYTGHR